MLVPTVFQLYLLITMIIFKYIKITWQQIIKLISYILWTNNINNGRQVCLHKKYAHDSSWPDATVTTTHNNSVWPTPHHSVMSTVNRPSLMAVDGSRLRAGCRWSSQEPLLCGWKRRAPEPLPGSSWHRELRLQVWRSRYTNPWCCSHLHVN